MERHLTFFSHPGLVPLSDGVNWRLDAPLKIQLPDGRNIVVPKGFRTDLASIPPLGVVGGIVMLLAAFPVGLPSIVPPWGIALGFLLLVIGFLICMASAYLKPFGKYTMAAVLHDWLFRTHFASFTVCNWYLLLAMREEKTARWERFLIWFNVQMFGYGIYRSEKRQREHRQDQAHHHVIHRSQN